MRITGTEAHVWVMDPSAVDQNTLEEYRSVLAGHELDRMMSLCFERHRLAFLVAHGLTRTALSWCAPAVHPARWSFQTRSHGRPEIVSPALLPALRFSLSHTDDLVACVVVQDVDCGIDVEVTSRRGDLDGLSRILAPAERSAVKRAPSTQRPALFMRFWTLKEAYAKATGFGLSLPFDRFAFDLDAGPEITVQIDPALQDDGAGWQLRQWWPSPRHTAALALRCGPRGPLRVVDHPLLVAGGASRHEAVAG